MLSKWQSQIYSLLLFCHSPMIDAALKVTGIDYRNKKDGQKSNTFFFSSLDIAVFTVASSSLTLLLSSHTFRDPTVKSSTNAPSAPWLLNRPPVRIPTPTPSIQELKLESLSESFLYKFTEFIKQCVIHDIFFVQFLFFFLIVLKVEIFFFFF